MNVDPLMLEKFEASLQRCTSDERFLHRFYQLFLQANGDIERRFAGVDLTRQASVLKASLYYMLRAASGFTEGMQHLRDIAKSHNRQGYDIQPGWYDVWLEALLTAVSLTDPHHDETVRAAWTESLTPCIEAMRSAWHDS